MKKMEKAKTPSERDKAFMDQYDYLLKWAFAQPTPEDKYGNEKRPYLSYVFVMEFYMRGIPHWQALH